MNTLGLQKTLGAVLERIYKTGNQKIHFLIRYFRLNEFVQKITANRMVAVKQKNVMGCCDFYFFELIAEKYSEQLIKITFS